MKKIKVKAHKRRVKRKVISVKEHTRYVPSPGIRNKKYPQKGTTNLKHDKRYHAKKPGWRLSENGRWYFENRKNRSDTHKWV